MKNQQGFTLIEVMIVVVVVSILVAIALPSYQESIAKSKRAEAQAALLSLSAAMERGYTENNSYCDLGGTGGASSCGAGTNDTGTPSVFSPTVPLDGGTAYYNLTISAATANSYTLTATRTGSMASDKCGNFTLTNVNVQGIASADSNIKISDCWR